MCFFALFEHTQDTHQCDSMMSKLMLNLFDLYSHAALTLGDIQYFSTFHLYLKDFFFQLTSKIWKEHAGTDAFFAHSLFFIFCKGVTHEPFLLLGF